MLNINPETGVRYGVISANSIDGDIFSDIYDIVYEKYSQECLKEALKDAGINPENDDAVNEFEGEFLENFYDAEEISGEFDLDGIKGVLQTLGGAYIIFITEGPWITKARPCSPCCPNACDLNSIDLKNGLHCYDVPNDWRK